MQQHTNANPIDTNPETEEQNPFPHEFKVDLSCGGQAIIVGLDTIPMSRIRAAMRRPTPMLDALIAKWEREDKQQSGG